MGALKSLLAAHWPLAVAALIGAAASWFLKPNPPPAVHEVVEDHQKAQAEVKQDQVRDEGAWSVKTWEFAPGGGNGSPQAAAPKASAGRVPDVQAVEGREGRQLHVEVGCQEAGQPWTPEGAAGAGPLLRYTEQIHEPTHVETHTDAKEQSSEDRKLDLTVAPSSARYSLFLGGQVRPEMHLALGGAVRIGPVWLQAEVIPLPARPLESSVIVGLRHDF